MSKVGAAALRLPFCTNVGGADIYIEAGGAGTVVLVLRNGLRLFVILGLSSIWRVNFKKTTYLLAKRFDVLPFLNYMDAVICMDERLLGFKALYIECNCNYVCARYIAI